MKMGKKILSTLMAFAIAAGCLMLPTIDASAAPKTSTFVIDKKSRVCYPTKVRVGLDSHGNSFSVYMPDEGDYISSVKTSDGLIAKVSGKDSYYGDYSTSRRIDGQQESSDYKTVSDITCFAEKKGTYSVTFTVKNKKKKTICTKTVKIYAEDYAYPVKSLKYAGKDYLSGDTNLTSQKSGQLTITMNKGFKLQKVELGTYAKSYTEYPEPIYKEIKNKSTITLATEAVYHYTSYSFSSADNLYSNVSARDYDHLYPPTFIRLTYKDAKLGITRTTEYILYYQAK